MTCTIFALICIDLHFFRAERKAGDVFHRAMLAVMLLRCMKKYGYFGPDTKDDVLTDDECYIGFVLNHFLEVNQFNAHEVAQVFIAKVWVRKNRPLH